MRWFHKSLLWASVGCFSVSPALAQTSSPAAGSPTAGGVGLRRPQPLDAAAEAAPAVVPAFLVRGQMEDRREPYVVSATANTSTVPPKGATTSVEMPVVPGDARLKTSTQIPTEPTKSGPSEAMPVKGFGQPDDKTFVAPPPRPFFRPINGAYATEGTVLFGTSGAPDVPRFWARAEYLDWWTKGFHIPILVTTAPATDPEATRGALGFGGTAPLFGGNSTNIGPTSGARFTAGYNFDPCGLCGLEVSYFFLDRNSDSAVLDSTRFPVLARPFLDVNTGMQDRQLATTPGTLPGDQAVLTGNVTIRDFSEIWGVEANFRRQLRADCNWSVSSIAGFRYLDLREGLSITENIVSGKAIPGDTLGIFNPGNRIIVIDNFRTQNRFYGGQLGAEGEYRNGRWSIMGRLQVALGVTHQNVEIAGSQFVTTPAGQTTAFPTGGLLALPSNSGSFAQDRFGVVPQVGVKIGYNITDNIRVFAGYDFLYWSNVLRPGDQIDTVLNSSQIPNFGFVPPSNIVRPIVPFRTSSYYAHGITAGIEVRY